MSQTRKVYSGPYPEGIRDRWLQEVIEKVNQQDTDSWIWLVPGRDLALYLREQVVKRTPKGCLQLNFLTFDQLIRIVLEQSDTAYYMIPRHFQQRMLGHLMNDEQTGSLTWEGKPLSAYSRSSSTIDGILQVFSLLKRQSVMPQHLHPADEDASEEYKILYELYHAYQKELLQPELHSVYGAANFKFLDIEEGYFEAAQLLKEKGIHTFFPGLQTLYLDSFVEIEPYQLNVLTYLLELEKAEVVFPYDNKSWPLLKDADEDARTFISLFQQRGFEIIHYQESEGDGKSDSDAPSYSVVSASSEEKEWLYVCKQIKKRMIEKVKPEDIAIVTYRKPMYDDPLYRLLKKEEIPIRYRFSQPLEQVAEMDDLLTLYSLEENQYDRRSLQQLANSPLFSMEIKPGDSRGTSLYSLELWGKKLGITGGLDIWLNTIDRELEQQQNPELNSIKQWLKQISKLTSPIPKKGKLMNHAGVFQSIVKKYPQLSIVTYVLDLLSDIRRSSIYIKDDQIYTPVEFVQFLRQAMQGLEVVKEDSTKGVWLLEPIQVRGLSFSHMFFVGLNEGEFPNRESMPWFLTERLRIELKDYIRLNQIMSARQQRKKIYFYQAIKSSQTSCVFSYISGRMDLMPSRYLDELIRTYGLSETDAGDYLNGPRLFPEEWQELSNVDEWRDWVASQIHQSMMIENVAEDERTQLFSEIPVLDEKMTLDTWDDIILRALAEQAREKGESSVFHGQMSASQVLKQIQGRLPSAFSVTYFNTYGQCPFKFYMSRILGLADADEEIEDVDHLEKGNIYHEVMQRLYRKLFLDSETDLSSLSPILQESKQIFDEMWKQTFANRYQEESLRNRLEKQRMWDKLKRFITYDLERVRESVLRPRYFEWGFGMNRKADMEMDAESVDEPLYIDGIPFRGKIDRIDITAQGQFVVYDYKTSGGANDIKHIKDGYDFQLPVYVKAVNELLMDGQATAIGAAYYSIEKRDYVNKAVFHKDRAEGKGLDYYGPIKTKKPEDWDVLMEESIKRIPQYLHDMKQGNFQVAPRVNITHCNRYCPYRRICRFNPLSAETEVEGL